MKEAKHPYGGEPRVLRKLYRAQPVGAGSTALVLHPDLGIRPGDRVREEVFPDGSARLEKVEKAKKRAKARKTRG